MKILFACGGTAGHINPALAVAEELRKRDLNTEILFAGNPNGMEARLIPQAGYAFEPIEVAGLQRKPSLENVKRNIKAAYLLMKSSKRAKKIISDFKPDIVMGTGGYVSGSIVRKAHQMGIKTLTHEQNAFPGITTKLLAPNVDKILFAVEGARKYFKDEILAKSEVVGNPVRDGVLTVNREEARERLGIGDKICIVSFGGSLGASRINDAVRDVIKYHIGEGKIHHIHATGRYDYKDFIDSLKADNVPFMNNPNVDIREYIDNMPTCLAASDLVISRSGAITLSEIECAGKASILIPSPNVAENHQYFNAMELVENNAAMILEEKDLTGESLTNMVKELCENKAKLEEVGKNASKMAIRDSSKRIADIILELVND